MGRGREGSTSQIPSADPRGGLDAQGRGDGALRGRSVACSCLGAHFHPIFPHNPSSAHALQVDESTPPSSRLATLLSLFQLL